MNFFAIIESCLANFDITTIKKGKFFALQKLIDQGFPQVAMLPMSLQVILESLLRHYDDKIITAEHILSVISWRPGSATTEEIPLFISRVILQDYSGLPLLNDISAMRQAAQDLSGTEVIINPTIPTSLVVDHTTQTHYVRSEDALQKNMEIEFQENEERYQFLKWTAKNFDNLEIIPPGTGIIHQINLEYLVKGVLCNKEGIYYPDTVIGTDSHTTMVNGIGVVGWGMGGIEAGGAILGAPIFFTIPDIIGVHFYGKLKEGVTATDLVLTLTELLRKAKVTGKIIEYCGPGVASLTAQERATIANMAPDYGAMMGLFPVDEKTIQYYYETGRSTETIDEITAYYKAQGWFGIPELNSRAYTQLIEVNLNDISACLAGPKQPQDKIKLEDAKEKFEEILIKERQAGGYGLHADNFHQSLALQEPPYILTHGDILIASITSCTNTANPSLLIMAGLLAKKAIEKGLSVKSHIKTSLAPGSKVVISYLKNAGLLTYLESLGFFLAGYGCTTCVGNVGKLNQVLEKALKENEVIATAVLSGNRNFEARIHPLIRTNFLMSPPLVIAFAIAGTIRINMLKTPLGIDKTGNDIFLKDIWPSSEEVMAVLHHTKNPQLYRDTYNSITQGSENWKKIMIKNKKNNYYDVKSSFIMKPPFFKNFEITPSVLKNIYNARALLILGDSITTDHISPVGRIQQDSPAAQYLLSQNIAPENLGTYGERRGNHEVMIRGTFANVRLKNKILNNVEGPYTINWLQGKQAGIYETAFEYQNANISPIIFAGEEYGSGSARDWAAKGVKLLGVKIIIADSFERIHRNNLVGMGIIPCSLTNTLKVEELQLSGSEIFDVLGIDILQLKQELCLIVRDQHGNIFKKISILPRLENTMELTYILHGGMMPYTLRNIIRQHSDGNTV